MSRDEDESDRPFTIRPKRPVYRVMIRRPDTMEILAEDRSAGWKGGAIRAYNSLLDLEREWPRLHVHIVRELSPTRFLVQFGHRMPRAAAIDLDPEVVVDLEDITDQTPFLIDEW